MMKKLTLLAAAIVATAVGVVPAAAQASNPVITNVNGEPAEHVTFEGTGATATTSIGVLRCTTMTLAVDLEANTENTAVGTGTGVAQGNPQIPTHTGVCVSEPSGAQFSYTQIILTSFDLGGGKGVATFKYTVDIPALGTMCTLFRQATLTYTSTSDTITVVPVSNPTECFGAAVLSFTFTITDEFGIPVELH
jgi:hypothetical protein